MDNTTKTQPPYPSQPNISSTLAYRVKSTISENTKNEI
ncbi:hypothetical protein FRUB_00197 [Fimbriiglobus ruber]|uniref:Uncharacterized protein n=1 Tax=Fimbriiglobus ruber TaxID=1908690 RepID=A0A225E6R6_9BACT|nr:hypothetical protein FRUB_00197 [Fimbriiglobus ruber]